MKQKLVLVGIMAILITFIIGIYVDTPIKKINVNVDGIKYRVETENDQENVEVRMEGDCYNNFFTGKRFEGKIYINDYVLYDLFLKFDECNRAQLNSVSPWLNINGKIFSNHDFTEFTIYFSKSVIGNWKIEDDLMVAWPASNRDQALDTSKELITDMSGILYK